MSLKPVKVTLALASKSLCGQTLTVLITVLSTIELVPFSFYVTSVLAVGGVGFLFAVDRNL